MVVAAAVSYGHQRELLASWGVDQAAQYAVPLTVDLLAITCNIALHIPDVARRGFWTSLLVLVLAVAVSGTANFIAGGTLGAKCANLWTVLAYLLSEFVTSAVKARSREKDPVRVAAGKKAARTRSTAPRTTATRKPRTPKAPATAAEANRMLAVAGAAPVSPAPAGQ
jgi:predicted lipid-binding transport protein (Tim44 family)